jgi:hypothetical protein
MILYIKMNFFNNLFNTSFKYNINCHMSRWLVAITLGAYGRIVPGTRLIKQYPLLFLLDVPYELSLN